MTRSDRTPRRFPRFAVGAGVTVFLVLAGTGVASAVWTTAPSSLSSSVAAGSLVLSQSGSASLAATYTPSALSRTAAITVANVGSVPDASYTVQVVAPTATTLANSTMIAAWSVGAAADCTSAAAVPATSLTATLSAGLSYSAGLAVGASAVFCVRTSIPSSYVTDGSVSRTELRLTYATGSWTGGSTQTATQAALDGTAPSAPGTPVASATTSTQTTLAWAAAIDNIGVTAYDMYRNGTKIASTTSSTLTLTDSGLVRGTSYTYAVRARDAAGNSSAASGGVAVTTPTVDNNGRYTITNPNSGLCVDAGTAPGNGTPLTIFGCSASRVQSWQFVATTGSDFKIVATNSATLGWDIDNSGGTGRNDFQKAQLWSYGGGSNQQWQVVSEGAGAVHFVNQNGSGKCLDINGASKTSGTQLQQYTCDGTVAQSFTLTPLP